MLPFLYQRAYDNHQGLSSTSHKRNIYLQFIKQNGEKWLFLLLN
ncbi:hypothetical protein [Moraxella lacunata]